jgi:uncharacterized protein YkwD
LCLVLLFPAPAVAGSYAPKGEYRLEQLIKREHYRVCGHRIYRSDRLQSIARWRSKDMVQRDYFAHVIKGTSKYVWDYYPYVDGEIIAWNMGYPAPAEQAFRQFMGSAPHRAMIRDCRYRRLGAGAYYAGGKHMFTVLFHRP